MGLSIKLRKWQRLATSITEEEPKHSTRLIGMECPNCTGHRLIFSFTKKPPPSEGCGLFIVCEDCNDGVHYRLGRRPHGFREELVLVEFQRLEDEASKRSQL